MGGGAAAVPLFERAWYDERRRKRLADASSSSSSCSMGEEREKHRPISGRSKRSLGQKIENVPSRPELPFDRQSIRKGAGMTCSIVDVGKNEGGGHEQRSTRPKAKATQKKEARERERCGAELLPSRARSASEWWEGMHAAYASFSPSAADGSFLCKSIDSPSPPCLDPQRLGNECVWAAPFIHSASNRSDLASAATSANGLSLSARVIS